MQQSGMKQGFQLDCIQAQRPPALQSHVTDALAMAHLIDADQIEGIGQGVNRLTKINSDAHTRLFRERVHGWALFDGVSRARVA